MVKINKEKIKKWEAEPPPAARVCPPGEKSFLQEKYSQLGLKKFEKLKAVPSNEKKVETEVSNEVDFYIREIAFDKMLKHCYDMALEGNEAMGLLVGDVKQWKSVYSIVYDVATASLDSSPFYVRFSRDAFEELFDKLDDIEYDYIILGWYHSHVGYTSFMSGIDIQTQMKYFSQPFHAAIVIDPINIEAKAFRISNRKCIEVPYAVFK